MLGLGKLARRLIGTSHDRVLMAASRIVGQINDLENHFQSYPDEALRSRTVELRERAVKGEPLDQLVQEAFANCREAARRTIGLRAFDVQLLGGIFLHQGKIAEMLTGEGKTLAATFPAYLNALTGKGVHIVTVNEYLARRDAEMMGKVLGSLGLSTGLLSADQSPASRRAAYRADITYATHSEVGFDYLRDNMTGTLTDMVQRGHAYAIVDEVDSILIDDARTPLIISGPSTDHSDLYRRIDAIVGQIKPEHFHLDRAARQVSFTEEGNGFLERELTTAALLMDGQSLYARENTTLVNHVVQALRARFLYQRDQHYIIRDSAVLLVDQQTGRTMAGRRLSDGLHQAIEAKEGVSIRAESTTLASISYQNYFRLYHKLSGMTGTAATDAEEFMATFGLDVVQIPPNRAVQRRDERDRAFRTSGEKLDAIVEMVQYSHSRGQPILVGTSSIEKSETISAMLQRASIPHSVLNANHHEREAVIIADAGRLGAVTIATNMAGRGTDIQLGGNIEARIAIAVAECSQLERDSVCRWIEREHAEEKAAVIAAGGLFVLGTERHESRRIDNQLRGRSGRQGDPGKTSFYISLEDELLMNFGPDDVAAKLWNAEQNAVDAAGLEKAVKNAQSRAQNRAFDIRKRLLDFDGVVNDQRRAIFAMRMRILRNENIGEMVRDMRRHVIGGLVGAHLTENQHAENWDWEGLASACKRMLAVELPFPDWAAEDDVDADVVRERIERAVEEFMASKGNSFGLETMLNFQKQTLLKSLDRHWREHQQQLDQLQISIGLRAYAFRNPLLEFKGEAFSLFENMITLIREDVSTKLGNLQPLDETAQLQLMSQMMSLRSPAGGGPRS